MTPRVVNVVEEILMCMIITRNPLTHKVSILNVGNEAKGMEALSGLDETPVKIEPPVVVETTSPVQTAVNPPRRRGRPAGSKNKSTVETTTPVAAVETPVTTPVAAVETTTTKRRGRPRKNPEAAAPAAPAAPAAAAPAAPAAAAAAAAAAATQSKGFNKPLVKKIFVIANMVGKGMILTKKNKEMEVWIVGEEGDKIRVCNPDKDQSSMKKGFVFGATWKIEQDRLIKML